MRWVLHAAARRTLEETIGASEHAKGLIRRRARGQTLAREKNGPSHTGVDGMTAGVSLTPGAFATMDSVSRACMPGKA